jgi:hypothetical protein
MKQWEANTMAAIIIKIIDQSKPDLVAQAKGELIGAGFRILGEYEAEMLGVDAVKFGQGEQTYGPATVVIGTDEDEKLIKKRSPGDYVF